MRLSAKNLFGWHNQPQEVSGALSDRFTFFFFGTFSFLHCYTETANIESDETGKTLQPQTHLKKRILRSLWFLWLVIWKLWKGALFACTRPAIFLSKLHLSYVISFQLIKFKELSLPKTAMAVRTTMKQLKDLWNLQIPKDITIKNASQK